MKQKVLIVEDQFIEANDLELMLTKAGYQVTGIAASVDEANALIRSQPPNLVLIDIFLKGAHSGIDLAFSLREQNIPFIFVSANSNHEVLKAAKVTQPHGFIVKPFRERDLFVTLEIAQFRHENSAEANAIKQEMLERKLQQIADRDEDWQQKMLATAKILQTYIPFDYMLADAGPQDRLPFDWISFLRIGFDEYQTIGIGELSTMTQKPVAELESLWRTAPREPAATIANGDDFSAMAAGSPGATLIRRRFGMNSLAVAAVRMDGGDCVNLFFYSRNPKIYNREHLLLLQTFNNVLAHAIKKMPDTKVHPSTSSPANRAGLGQRRGKNETVFEGIIGKSHLMLHVLDNVSQVAPADTSVLILGESGTGKEKIAKCIHELSARKKGPLVALNCAALPANLIESELFGHERGAFTGAIDKRIGKFELAHRGTLFLDELGEMPVELQAKLLRVLQEKEIERLGGSKPIKVDVRIIAATNRDLEKEVAAGRFRLDLYYRLNIFPISLPSLRERKEDIPLLVRHFLDCCAERMEKKPGELSEKGMQAAVRYHWPGNIRELENLVERAMILNPDGIIESLQIPWNNLLEHAVPDGFQTIEANEREHIKKALEKCRGKVWGSGGAAELLGLPASTLNSRMKKLGINRDFLLG